MLSAFRRFLQISVSDPKTVDYKFPSNRLLPWRQSMPLLQHPRTGNGSMTCWPSTRCSSSSVAPCRNCSPNSNWRTAKAPPPCSRPMPLPTRTANAASAPASPPIPSWPAVTPSYSRSPVCRRIPLRHPARTRHSRSEQGGRPARPGSLRPRLRPAPRPPPDPQRAGPARHGLYRAATSAVHWNPDSQACHDRLSQRGKPHKVALVTVLRKLAGLLDTLLRGDRLWQPEPPARPPAHPLRSRARLRARPAQILAPPGPISPDPGLTINTEAPSGRSPCHTSLFNGRG